MLQIASFEYFNLNKLPFRRKIQNYNRNSLVYSSTVDMPHLNSTFRQICPDYKSIDIYNKMSSKIKLLNNIRQFKTKLQQYLI